MPKKFFFHCFLLLFSFHMSVIFWFVSPECLGHHMILEILNKYLFNASTQALYSSTNGSILPSSSFHWQFYWIFKSSSNHLQFWFLRNSSELTCLSRSHQPLLHNHFPIFELHHLVHSSRHSQLLVQPYFSYLLFSHFHLYVNLQLQTKLNRMKIVKKYVACWFNVLGKIGVFDQNNKLRFPPYVTGLNIVRRPSFLLS